MTTGLSDFYKHNLWANLRLLDACAQRSDEQLDATMGGTFGSIRETLMHLFSSEEGYARHVTGKIPNPPLKEFTTFPGFDELQRRAKMSGELLIEAINHGTDHRSQIATLLSQQGIEPPSLDAWDYNDSMR